MSADGALSLRDTLRRDFLRAHRRPDPLRPADYLRLAWQNPGLQALTAYRLERWCAAPHRSIRHRLLARLLRPLARLGAAFARAAYDITLDQSADIAPGFYIGHLGGIVVRECRIGGNSSIGQQVRIGVDVAAPDAVAPAEIGHHVWIGAHARLCRAIRVGDGATIGAGTCVRYDVPSRSLVLGNPGRVARREFDNGEML